LEGHLPEKEKAQRYIEECQQMSAYRKNRTKSFEWYTEGIGIKSLVHQSMLGEWQQQVDFWENRELLKYKEGIISIIKGPEAGYIEIAGLKAFFVPGRKENPITTDDINKKVRF